MSQPRVAVLYQALPPPSIGGARKSPKPGGYSDSGADIAFTLRKRGIAVATAVAKPRPEEAMDWVFPDTVAGIASAGEAGAVTVWANTVLFRGHPIEAWRGRIVGQTTAASERVDDKFSTNRSLRESGLPVAASVEAGKESGLALDALDARDLAAAELEFPVVVKPVRGRGSQGVAVAGDLAELRSRSEALIASGEFGDRVILERFLPGDEITITVMPPGGMTDTYWALPPVRRLNHEAGIAPYNGAVAVTRNSVVLTAVECLAPAVQTAIDACVAAAAALDARAPIRIDCRADRTGKYLLFDVNFKPNMTGAGRPGRDDQDSLTAIAARAVGWNYGDLLLAMLRSGWQA